MELKSYGGESPWGIAVAAGLGEVVVISDRNGLEEWRRSLNRPLLPGAVSVPEFDFPSLHRDINRRLSLEAARLARACGCTASGLAMTMTLLVIAIRLFVSSRPLAGVGLLGWGEYLLAVVAAAVVGKLAGLLWAQSRLIRLGRFIEASLRTVGVAAP